MAKGKRLTLLISSGHWWKLVSEVLSWIKPSFFSVSTWMKQTDHTPLPWQLMPSWLTTPMTFLVRSWYQHLILNFAFKVTPRISLRLELGPCTPAVDVWILRQRHCRPWPWWRWTHIPIQCEKPLLGCPSRRTNTVPGTQRRPRYWPWRPSLPALARPIAPTTNQAELKSLSTISPPARLR